MNRLENLFIKFLFIIGLTLSSTACSDEEIFKQVKGDGSLSFAITDENSLAESRSGADIVDYPTFGMHVSGNDSLYLHTDVTDYEILNEKNTSRGVPVGKENFDSEVPQIDINAYIDEKPYIAGYAISKSGEVWTGADKRYWPDDKAQEIDFYAAAQIAYDIAISHSAGATRLAYEVPSSNGKMTDAEFQPDILLGYTKASYNSLVTEANGSTDVSVPITMHHALAAVCFEVDDFRKGTIKSITIRNARKSGQLTYTQGSESDAAVMDWKLDSELTDFTQTFNIAVEDDKDTPLTAQRKETTFMLLPQDLEEDEVTFIVDLEYEENGEKQNIQLSAPAINAGDIKEWEAGKLYTYRLSSSSINWTYVFEIIEGDGKSKTSFSEGEQDGYCEVVSYRYRKSDPTRREEVAWTATAGNAKDDGATDFRKPEEWIDSMLNRGKGSIEGEIWRVTVTPNRLLRTDFDGDEILKNNTPRGSATDPWDLSVKTYDGNDMSMSTANCYVVNSPGTYCFPAVFGNSYKNGEANSVAYSHTHAQSVTGGKAEIEGIADAITLWMDGLGILSNVRYDKATNMVVFTIDKDHIQQANATIGVRNANGDILWSWHIWVYEHNIWSESIELEDFDDTRIRYQMMNNNLGRCDAKTVWYDSREGSVTFTQEKSGKTGSVTLTLHKFEVTTQDINSAVYQWGRKDPFMGVINASVLAADNRKFANYKKCYPTGGKYLVKDGGPENVPNGFTVQQSILAPNRIVRDGYTGRWMQDVNIYAWNSLEMDERQNGRYVEKTIFDPCPAGFKVPNYALFKLFSVDGANHTGDHQAGDEGDKLDEEIGRQFIEEYLNGDVVNMRHYKLYGKKNPVTSGTNPDSQFEMFSTGKRPYSATDFSFNGLFLWSCGAVEVTEGASYQSYLFQVGYEGNYLLHVNARVNQACVYPVRPILENTPYTVTAN